MKKLISTLVLANFIFLLAGQIPTTGLVAWYPFNGNANDVSGNENNGTINGATLTTDRFGNANSAYSFNGTNNYIEIPNSTSLDLSSNIYSISFWMKSTYPAINTCEFITKYSGIGASCNGLIVVLNNPTNGNNLEYMYESTSTGGWGFAQTSVESLPQTGSWFHVMITTNNGYDKLYINGVLVSSNGTKHSYKYGSNTSPLRFGCGPSQNTGKYFTGGLDDIRIYNKELLQSEVNLLFNESICKTSTSVTDTLFIKTNLTSFNPLNYQNTVKIYPNPTKDAVTIDFGTNFTTIGSYKIKISNSLGQTVYQSLITQQKTTINLNSWTGKGMYIVELIDSNSNTIENKKIVLQ